jgi:hypothetical protein
MEAMLPEDLEREIRRIDGILAPLIHNGLDLSLPRLRERLPGAAAEMRQRQSAIEAARQEGDRLLPELLGRYIDGGTADREAIRALLLECPSFRWGFGWGIANRITTPDDARWALALLSMKDGASDPRDQIVALDHIYLAIRQAGLPLAALLSEAGTWSSDTPRFGKLKFRSTRALLLDYAQRLGA